MIKNVLCICKSTMHILLKDLTIQSHWKISKIEFKMSWFKIWTYSNVTWIPGKRVVKVSRQKLHGLNIWCWVIFHYILSSWWTWGLFWKKMHVQLNINAFLLYYVQKFLLWCRTMFSISTTFTIFKVMYIIILMI